MKTFLKKISNFKVFLLLIPIFTAISVYSFVSNTEYFGKIAQNLENPFLKKLLEKFEIFAKTLPQDRVYLQLDKTLYKPGETIWFAAYIRNATDMSLSEKSDILNVEFINPKGNKTAEIKLIAKKGKALGDFLLEEQALGGIYKIKAYTQWQKNEPQELVFEKEITVQKVILPRLKMKLEFDKRSFGKGEKVSASLNVQTNENQPLTNFEVRFLASLKGEKLTENKTTTDKNGNATISFELPKNLQTSDGLLNVMLNYEGQTESISRSIPIILNFVKLNFFPEGGDLVADLQCKVAFRSLNEFDKPADIEGTLYNSGNEKIISFKSFHFGMGSFEFTPKKDEKYFVKITSPTEISQIYHLPEVLPKGYVLKIDSIFKNQVKINIFSTEETELILVSQIRGKIYHSQVVYSKKGKNEILLSTEKLPIGVMQLTLFDSKGIERCERLVFVNKHKQMKIKIETDKEKYLPREKVKLTIKVSDENEMPIPANLSLSVVDDQLLTFTDDKQGNILSEMFLRPDIKGEIEEPQFYFKKDEPKADKTLDYLLMTAGWRRFTWEKILNEQPTVNIEGEKAIIKGKIINGEENAGTSDVEIEIQGKKFKPNEKGEFMLENIDLSEQQIMKVSPKNGNFEVQSIVLTEYSQNVVVYLYFKRRYYNRAIEEEKAAGGAVKAAKGEHKRRDADKDDFNPPPVIEIEENNEEQSILQEEPPKLEEQQVQQNQPVINDAIVVDGDVDDLRANVVAGKKEKKRENVSRYYRAKVFAAPVYKQNEKIESRTDFRSTIFWNGNIDIDRTGKTSVEFCNSDDITSFRIVAEGIGTEGSVGREGKTYFTQLPFSLSVKMPLEATKDDKFSIPLTLKNNTSQSFTGNLTVKLPSTLKFLNSVPQNVSLNANETKILYLETQTIAAGTDKIEISFASEGLKDKIAYSFNVVSRGFPVTASFSNREKEKTYSVTLTNVVEGSISAQLTAFPSVVSDLVKGVESILREPYGCFEQTSMSSYPNVMVMNYLNTTETKDSKLLATATNLLDKGYKRLISFETSEKGYEWFGGAPGHEALTAYGLMQFNDMKKVYSEIDQKMIDRTANWLLSRKDGKGGFQRNPRALDSYGSASTEITNLYIVYALCEAGYLNDIEKELNFSYEKSISSDDAYQIALLVSALFAKNDSRAAKTLELLYSKQNADGSFTGKTHSITRSEGISLTIETTSLAILGMLKSGKPKIESLQKAVEFLISQRSGYGMFGSTQGTILALKALTKFAEFSKRTAESGNIEIFVDNKKVAVQHYEKGENNPILISGLEKHFADGTHTIKIAFTDTKEALPYSVAVKWNTSLPNSSKDCSVSLTSELAKNSAKVGETVRLTNILTNVTAKGQPMTVAIIGIPAGLTAQMWQLKELQEKKVFDFYEIIGNNLVVYYRQMLPNEKREINLDLKAEIPGEYQAAASCAYLYYTNEFKNWTISQKISVTK